MKLSENYWRTVWPKDKLRKRNRKKEGVWANVQQKRWEGAINTAALRKGWRAFLLKNEVGICGRSSPKKNGDGRERGGGEKCDETKGHPIRESPNGKKEVKGRTRWDIKMSMIKKIQKRNEQHRQNPQVEDEIDVTCLFDKEERSCWQGIMTEDPKWEGTQDS